MSDLISRQAAIEAIEEMQIPIMRSIFPEEQFVFKGMSEALSAIKDLPSVQPEVIRCKNCAKREYCRTSTVWAVPPSDDWFCGDAEPYKGEK